MAMDGDEDGRLWAVGYARTPVTLRPLVVRKSPRGDWRAVETPRRRAGATLTDVGTDGAAGTWAVGYTIGKPGRHAPWALRWAEGRFVDRSPRLASGEHGRLTAVSVSAIGGTWIAGSVVLDGIDRPYIDRRTDGGWERQALPDVGEGAIADIDVRSADVGWAVGYRQAGSGVQPLVLRWDGQSWQTADTTGLADDPALLMAAWTAGGGRATVVGSAWDRPSVRFEGLTARSGNGGWTANTLTTLPGQTGLTAVDGVEGPAAWLAGSTLFIGAALRTCEEVSVARVEGRDARAERSVALAERRVARAQRRAIREQRRREGRSVARSANRHGVKDDVLAPRPVGSVAGLPRLRFAAADTLRLRDRTVAAGLPRSSVTYGAVVADFDDDGADDIFLGRHGSQAQLLLDRGGRFIDAGVSFGTVDRHGCAADDVDGSGFPDLYCSVGARRGTGVKANQLWLDPGTEARTLDPVVGRAAEPLGRGRVATFLDVDGDGRQDLFVGQETERMDGLPSDNRLYLRTGPARFQAVTGSGVDPTRAARSVSTGDIDADGSADLVLVYSEEHALRRTGGMRLYHAIGGRFRDVTSRQGIRSIGETDAELALLDGDDRSDLVQLSASRIRVSLKGEGGFRTVYERRIEDGVALAVGDVDGDGDADIYVLRQKDRRGDDDVLLLSRRGAAAWRAIRVPSRPGGIADDVYPIDHDADGRTDFVALNGKDTAPGPIQLIAAYPD
jgi:hypothetical protein